MVSRREQLGTADHQLEGTDDGTGKPSGRGRRPKKVDEKDVGKSKGNTGMKRPAAAKTTRASKAKPVDDKPKAKGDNKETAGSAPEPKQKPKRNPKKAKDSKQSEEAMNAADEKGETNEESKITPPKKEATKRKRKEQNEVKDDTKHGKTEKDAKTGKGDDKDIKGAKVKEAKVSRTWAGRWIPADPVGLAKMTAIRQVFDLCLSKKFRSPSTMASPFFMVCSKAFKSKGLDNAEATSQQLIAAAELEVRPFLALESVRPLAIIRSNFCFGVSRG